MRSSHLLEVSGTYLEEDIADNSRHVGYSYGVDMEIFVFEVFGTILGGLALMSMEKKCMGACTG